MSKAKKAPGIWHQASGGEATAGIRHPASGHDARHPPQPSPSGRGLGRGSTPSSSSTLPQSSLLLPSHRGFTLIELIVAGLVAALVAAAAGIGLAQTLRVRTAVEAHAEAQRRADLAAESIRRDLQGTLRDGDLFYVTVRVIDRGDAERGQDEFDELLIFAQSDRRVRPMDIQPESGEYEVQYRAAPGPGIGGQPLPGWSAPTQPQPRARRGGTPVRLGPAHTLWRRADPMPDDVPDGGGIILPVTEGITRLSFLAFDGQRWETAWDSDTDGLPHAVRVLIEARDDTGRATATAIRTVAIDRVPIPYVTVSGTAPGAGGGGSRANTPTGGGQGQ